MLRLLSVLCFLLSFAVPPGTVEAGIEVEGPAVGLKAFEAQPPLYFSRSNPARFIDLDRVGQGFSTPDAPVKGPSGGYLKSAFAFELKQQSAAVQYLLCSGAMRHGLTIRDIIFPFQYFW